MIPRLLNPHNLLIYVTFIVLMFANDDINGFLYQIVGVALLVLNACYLLLVSKRGRLLIGEFDLIVFALVSLSLVTSLIRFDNYSMTYTFVFLAAYSSISIISSRLSIVELEQTVFVAIVLVLILVVFLYGDVLLSTLTPGATNRWALRWAPFGLHPNLAGFIFGGFATILMLVNLPSIKYDLVIRAALIGLCIAIILAASARAGLLAFCVTIVFFCVVEASRRQMLTFYAASIGIVLTIVVYIFNTQLWNYLSEILELESTSRGFDSGGTGRIELWSQGIDYFTSRTWETITGSGLRSSRPEIIGFSTESSYITLLIDHGLFLTIVILGWVSKSFAKSLIAEKGPHASHRMFAYVILFALLQSVFNRYLIAIGNPFSIVILMLLSGVGKDKTL